MFCGWRLLHQISVCTSFLSYQALLGQIQSDSVVSSLKLETTGTVHAERAFEHNQTPSSSEKDRKKSKQCHKKPFNWKCCITNLCNKKINNKPHCTSKGYRWLGTQLDCNSQNAPHKLQVCLYTYELLSVSLAGLILWPSGEADWLVTSQGLVGGPVQLSVLGLVKWLHHLGSIC